MSTCITPRARSEDTAWRTVVARRRGPLASQAERGRRADDCQRRQRRCRRRELGPLRARGVRSTIAGSRRLVRPRLEAPRYLREEAQALRRARVVICNSRRTADDVVRRVRRARECTRVVSPRHRSACVRSGGSRAARREYDARSGCSRTGRLRCLSEPWAIGARVSTRCSRRGSISPPRLGCGPARRRCRR